MRIDVDALSFRLLKQLVEVAQVVPADQDRGTRSHAEVDLGRFGVAVRAGVGLVEQRHRLHAHLATLEHQPDQLLCRQRIICRGEQRLLEKRQQAVVRMFEHVGMVGVGGESLQAVGEQFTQRAQVFVLVLIGQDPDTQPLPNQLFAVARARMPRRHLRQCSRNSARRQPSREPVADLDPPVHKVDEPIGVKVGVGDRGKECLSREQISLCIDHTGCTALHTVVRESFEHP